MDYTQHMPTGRYVEALDSHFPNVFQTYPIDVSTERKSWVTLYPTNHKKIILLNSLLILNQDVLLTTTQLT